LFLSPVAAAAVVLGKQEQAVIALVVLGVAVVLDRKLI
jgi:hypothetical protein